jgi:hypothetical protein
LDLLAFGRRNASSQAAKITVHIGSMDQTSSDYLNGSMKKRKDAGCADDMIDEWLPAGLVSPRK